MPEPERPEHAFQDWVGRQAVARDRIAAGPVAALAATLDRDDPAPRDGDALPPLYHWLFFPAAARQSALGPDGHARRGGFLPPVALPRRMWAGGRLRFLRALHVGEAVERVSTIRAVSARAGRSGRLVFVTVEHEIAGEAGPAVVEAHDIVYRDAGGAAPTVPAPEGAAWWRAIAPDPVLLFRYSALTFNGHRIHYDRPYATQVEGYPGLVVHGPLMATLLVDLLRRHTPRRLAAFDFRATAPVFDTASFTLFGTPEGGGAPEGDGAALWVRRADGALAMRAEALLES